jgi:hypothetical protein
MQVTEAISAGDNCFEAESGATKSTQQNYYSSDGGRGVM